MSTVVSVEGISKQYRYGVINNKSLARDLRSWWALKRGEDDPNTRIGNESKFGCKDRFWALRNVSFEVKKGERLAIMGCNGAGKSTLLKIMSRVTAPTEGRIRIRGRVASLLEVGTGFHPELTGRENIYLNGAILGMKKHEITAKFDDIVEFSGLPEFIDTPVKRFSSGMFVRLAFAVAAHLDSDILIADEVLAVGDAKFQAKCLGKMRDVSEKDGRTVLFVSHNAQAVAGLCNRGIILDHGVEQYDAADINTVIARYNSLINNQ
jgi:lipopolysaccharide transport system ATP-binding protein